MSQSPNSIFLEPSAVVAMSSATRSTPHFPVIPTGLNQSAQRLFRVREELPWVNPNKTINAESVASTRGQCSPHNRRAQPVKGSVLEK
jgi:hypothetical protein